MLEHVEQDLQVIEHWERGTYSLCSVPNFDSDYHVRFFRTREDVFKRYRTLIEIDSIVVLKKPVLPDISWQSYFRALRWNRYRLKRLLEIAGLGDFNQVGGWFLFKGKKK